MRFHGPDELLFLTLQLQQLSVERGDVCLPFLIVQHTAGIGRIQGLELAFARLVQPIWPQLTDEAREKPWPLPLAVHYIEESLPRALRVGEAPDNRKVYPRARGGNPLLEALQRLVQGRRVTLWTVSSCAAT